MGLKKDSKVSAEFSMSSLTDIIFLLLIFFMLTSSAVIPNALNLRLPGKSSSQKELETKPYVVTISEEGKYFVNKKRVSIEICFIIFSLNHSHNFFSILYHLG